uniref:S1 motif domain-containing protein n=1 Tax=viral metagenome TaxID=1070528 RepID=A0A6C0BC87_9ZZZZ
MEQQGKPFRNKRREIKYKGIYSRAMITRNIRIPIKYIGKNIQQIIEKNIGIIYEGRCVVEGFVKPGSSKILTYSSGIVHGTAIQFEVVFECLVCCPVEGMLIQCIAKNITKAGIRGESLDESPSPVIIFITRDHHYMNTQFSSIKEGDKFVARVIGQRYELNDKYVSVIAELADNTTEVSKPRLVIG